MTVGITTTPAGDILANTHEMEWLDVGGGSYFKVLRLCEKTGQWTLYVRMEPCLLYTSPSPRDLSTSRMPSSA